MKLVNVAAHVRRMSATALAVLGAACLGNSPPGYRDHLYVLLSDPQRHGEIASAFETPSNSGCDDQSCVVRVEIIDLTNHTKVGGFSVPSTAQATDGTATGYANSFAVSRYGDRVYIGERMAEEVQVFSAGGITLGAVAAGAGLGGPLDLVLSNDDRTLFVLDSGGVSRISTTTMTNTGRWSPDKTTAYYGLGRRLALSPDGSTLVVTSDQSAYTWMFFIGTSNMATAGQYSIGYIPPPTCKQTVNALLFVPTDRLVSLDPSCHNIYYFDLTNHIHAGEVLFNKPLGNHFAYATSTNKLYGNVRNDTTTTSEVMAVSPAQTVEWLGQLPGFITDIVSNVDGISVYYSVTWTVSVPHTRRLAVVHAPTGVLADSVYFFPTTPGNEVPPRVMEMQVVRKILAPNEQPAARRDP